MTIDFGNVIDENINKHVLSIFSGLKHQNITGVKDIIPAYSSVTVVYDVVAVRKANPNTTAYRTMEMILVDCADAVSDVVAEVETIVRIPVCYEPAFAPDLHEMAALKNIGPETIVKLHSSKTYRVFMLGFLPGFAYMGTVDDVLAVPRKHTPRTKVAVGSVGIAGKQTGIYPFESPGGWNIIGQTPLKMFDAHRAEAALLKPGTQVQFYAIGEEEFNAIKAAQ
jgi:inhibitor of KinA